MLWIGVTEPVSGTWQHWEDLARLHGAGLPGYYDTEALVAGTRALRGFEADALAHAAGGRDLAELRVAHLQSHIGIDSIHLARLGCAVTAFDFSPTALAVLDRIATRCGLSIRTEIADTRTLRDRTEWHGAFDVAYATIGVVNWIDDLAAWMQGAAALLAPCGALALVEIHPLCSMVGSVQPLVLDFPYENDGPRHFEGMGSYADPDADVHWAIDEFAHSIGEVVTAAVCAGLRIELLAEHTSSASDPRGGLLSREADDRFRLRIGTGADGQPAEPLPVLYTLVARRDVPLAVDESAG